MRHGEVIDVTEQQHFPVTVFGVFEDLHRVFGIELILQSFFRFAFLMLTRFNSRFQKLLERIHFFVARSSALINDEVGRNLVEQGSYVVDFVSVHHVFPGFHEGFLHDVLRQLSVVDSEVAVPKDGIAVLIIDFREFFVGFHKTPDDYDASLS